QYGLGYDEYVEARQADNETLERRYEEYEAEKKRLRAAIAEARTKASAAERGRAASDNDKLNRNFRAQRASGHLAGAVGNLVTKLESLKPPEAPIEDIDLSFMFSATELNRQRLVDVQGL